jgi:hypothetical protein
MWDRSESFGVRKAWLVPDQQKGDRNSPISKQEARSHNASLNRTKPCNMKENRPKNIFRIFTRIHIAVAEAKSATWVSDWDVRPQGEFLVGFFGGFF